MKKILMVIGLLASSIALAEEYRQPVQNIKPLLIEAIKYGEAHGTLVGKMAEKMNKQFSTNEPILVDVKAISNLPQKGCKRLLISIKQDGVIDKVKSKKDGVVEKAKSPQSKETSYYLGFCDNGEFPPEQGEVRQP